MLNSLPTISHSPIPQELCSRALPSSRTLSALIAFHSRLLGLMLLSSILFLPLGSPLLNVCVLDMFLFFRDLKLLDAAPQINIPGLATVGVPLTCSFTMPNPVIDNLTITFSTTPASIPVEIDPLSFYLTSPGLNAGPVTYSFTIL